MEELNITEPQADVQIESQVEQTPTGDGVSDYFNEVVKPANDFGTEEEFRDVIKNNPDIMKSYWEEVAKPRNDFSSFEEFSSFLNVGGVGKPMPPIQTNIGGAEQKPTTLKPATQSPLKSSGIQSLSERLIKTPSSYYTQKVTEDISLGQARYVVSSLGYSMNDISNEELTDVLANKKSYKSLGHMVDDVKGRIAQNRQRQAEEPVQPEGGRVTKTTKSVLGKEVKKEPMVMAPKDPFGFESVIKEVESPERPKASYLQSYDNDQQATIDAEREMLRLKQIYDNPYESQRHGTLKKEAVRREELASYERAKKDFDRLNQRSSKSLEDAKPIIDNYTNALTDGIKWQSFKNKEGDFDIYKANDAAKKIAVQNGFRDDGPAVKYIESQIISKAQFKEKEPEILARYAEKEQEILGGLDADQTKIAEEFKGVSKTLAETSLQIEGLGKEISTLVATEADPIRKDYELSTSDIKTGYAALDQDLQNQLSQNAQLYNSGQRSFQEATQFEQQLNAQREELLNQTNIELGNQFDLLTARLNEVNSKYKQRYERQKNEIASAAEAKFQKEFQQFAKDKNLTEDAMIKLKAAYKDAYDATILADKEKRQAFEKEIGEGFFRVPEFKKFARSIFGQDGEYFQTSYLLPINTKVAGIAFENSLGTALEAIGNEMGFEAMRIAGKQMALSSDLLAPKEDISWGDLTDWISFQKSAGNLGGSMAPGLLATAAATAITGGLGVGTIGTMTIGGLVGWQTESMQMASQVYLDTLKETGDGVLAQRRADKMWDFQKSIILSYGLEALPFMGILRKGTSQIGRRIILGAAAELGTETVLQEFPQTVAEEAIMRDKDAMTAIGEAFKGVGGYLASKVGGDAPTEQEVKDYQLFKRVVIETAPVAVLGGGGQAISSLREQRVMDAAEKVGKAYMQKAVFGSVSPVQTNQFLSDLVSVKGVDFATTMVTGLFTSGQITEVEKTKMLEGISKSETIIATAKRQKMNKTESSVFSFLNFLNDDMVGQIEQESDPNVKSALESKQKAIETDLKNFLITKKSDLFIVEYADGSQTLMAPDDITTLSQNQAFINELRDGSLSIKGLSAEFTSKQKPIIDDLNARMEASKQAAPEGGLTVEEIKQGFQEQLDNVDISSPKAGQITSDIILDYIVAGNADSVEAAIDSGKPVDGKEASMLLDSLYTALARVDESVSMTAEQKADLQGILEPLISKIEGYDNITEGTTIKVTERQATARPVEDARKVKDQASAIENSRGKKGVLIRPSRRNANQRVKENVKSIDPATIPIESEVSIVRDDAGEIVGYSFTLPDGNELFVDDPGGGIDLALMQKNEIMGAPPQLMEQVFEDVMREVEVAAPTTKTETTKPTEDAVQEQAAGKVPIQPEAGVSETMAEGKPEAEPQVVTEEGQAEQAQATTEEKKEVNVGDALNIINSLNQQTPGQTEEAPRTYTTKNIDRAINDARKAKDAKLEKALVDAKAIMKALGKKDTKVVIHFNQGSYTQSVIQAGGDAQASASRGFVISKDGNVINLNLPLIQSNEVVLHEGAHPVLDWITKNNPERIDALYAELESLAQVLPGVNDAITFSKQYGNTTQAKKEAIVQFMALVADGTINLSEANPTFKQKAIEFIKKLLQAIGIDFGVKISDDASVVELAKRFTESVKYGREISVASKTTAAAPQFSMAGDGTKKLSNEEISNLVDSYRGDTDELVKFSDTVSIQKSGNEYRVTAMRNDGVLYTFRPMNLAEAKIFAENQLYKENAGSNINPKKYSPQQKRAQDLKIGDIYTRIINGSRYVFQLMSDFKKDRIAGQFFNADVKVLDVGNQTLSKELSVDGKIKTLGFSVGQTTIDRFKNMDSPNGFNLGEVTVINDFESKPPTGPQFSMAGVSQEMQDIVSKAKADGTFMKAPNGQPTKLNEQQWTQVRTQAFKNWFGDWENNPQDASKIVDDNGEPQVQYTGTSKDKDFDKFNIPQNGAWFTSDPEEASRYAFENDSMDVKFNPETRKYEDKNTAPRVIPVFLNIRRPEFFNQAVTEQQREKLRYADNYKKLQKQYFQDIYFRKPLGQRTDGLYYSDNKNVVVVLENPNQIKSAVGNSGTFSPENPKIQFSKAGGVPISDVITALRNAGATEQVIADALKQSGYYSQEEINDAMGLPAPQPTPMIQPPVTPPSFGVEPENGTNQRVNSIYERMALKAESEGNLELAAEIRRRGLYNQRSTDLVKTDSELLISSFNDDIEAAADFVMNNPINGDIRTYVLGQRATRAKQAAISNPTAENLAARNQAIYDFAAYTTDLGQATNAIKLFEEDNPDLFYLGRFSEYIATLANNLGNPAVTTTNASKIVKAAKEVVKLRKDILNKVANVISEMADDATIDSLMIDALELDKAGKNRVLTNKMRNGLRKIVGSVESKKIIGEKLKRLAELGVFGLEETREEVKELIRKGLAEINPTLQTPLDTAEIQEMAEMFMIIYEEMATQKMDALLDKAFNGNNKNNAAVIKAVMYGALDTPNALNKFAQKFGLSYITPQMQQQLKNAAQKVANAKGNTARSIAQAAFTTMLNKFIYQTKPTGYKILTSSRSFFKYFANVYYNTALFAFNTFFRAFQGNTLRTLGNVINALTRGEFDIVKDSFRDVYFRKKVAFNYTDRNGVIRSIDAKTQLVFDDIYSSLRGLPRLAEVKREGGLTQVEIDIRNTDSRLKRRLLRTFAVPASRIMGAVDASVMPLNMFLTKRQAFYEVLKAFYKDKGIAISEAQLRTQLNDILGVDTDYVSKAMEQAVVDVMGSKLWTDLGFTNADEFPTVDPRYGPLKLRLPKASRESKIYNEFLFRTREILDSEENKRLQDSFSKMGYGGLMTQTESDLMSAAIDNYALKVSGELAFLGTPRGSMRLPAEIISKYSTKYPFLKYVGASPLFTNAAFNSVSMAIRIAPGLNALQYLKYWYTGTRGGQKGSQKEFGADYEQLTKIDQNKMLKTVLLTNALFAVATALKPYDDNEEEKKAIDNKTWTGSTPLKLTKAQTDLGYLPGRIYIKGEGYDYRDNPLALLISGISFVRNYGLWSFDNKSNNFYVEDDAEIGYDPSFIEQAGAYALYIVQSMLEFSTIKDMSKTYSDLIEILSPPKGEDDVKQGELVSRFRDKKGANIIRTSIPYSRFVAEMKTITDAIMDEEKKLPITFYDNIVFGHAIEDNVIKTNGYDFFGRPVKDAFTLVSPFVSSFSINQDQKVDREHRLYRKMNYTPKLFLNDRLPVHITLDDLNGDANRFEDFFKRVKAEEKKEGGLVEEVERKSMTEQRVLVSLAMSKEEANLANQKACEFAGKFVEENFINLQDMDMSRFKDAMNSIYNIGREVAIYQNFGNLIEYDKADYYSMINNKIIKFKNTYVGSTMDNLTWPQEFEPSSILGDSFETEPKVKL